MRDLHAGFGARVMNVSLLFHHPTAVFPFLSYLIRIMEITQASNNVLCISYSSFELRGSLAVKERSSSSNIHS